MSVSIGRSNAQADLRRYPVRSGVTFYYNPRDPSDCLLEPGLHFSNLFLPLLGMLFMGSPCLILYLTRPVTLQPHARRRDKLQPDRLPGPDSPD